MGVSPRLVQDAKLAKERQGTRTDIVADLPQGEKRKARDDAAKAMGVSPRLVQDAKLAKERQREAGGAVVAKLPPAEKRKARDDAAKARPPRARPRA